MRKARLGLSFSCRKMGLGFSAPDNGVLVTAHKYGLSFRCDAFVPEAETFAYGIDDEFGIPEDKLGYLDKKRI